MRDYLTDTFGRHHTYLRISLTERCNLRCTYCMPAEGVPLKPRHEILNFEEIVRLAGIFAEGGVTRIRLTGGEPLVRKDIEHLVPRLASVAGIRDLAITTNGLLLRRLLPQLREGGVNQLNISLDTLKKDRFQQITRRSGLDQVLEAIDLAIEFGYEPVKVNCVVMRGTNDDELTDFVEWTRRKPVEVRFIEYMPFDGNGWRDDVLVPYAEMMDVIRQRYSLVRVQDGPHDTSKTYTIDGFAGRIGFITSMSDHFCSSCNRLRLTADGFLKVCLFGRREVSLRDALRDGASDADLKELIADAVQQKKERHAGMHAIAGEENRPMILIGG